MSGQGMDTVTDRARLVPPEEFRPPEPSRQLAGTRAAPHHAHPAWGRSRPDIPTGASPFCSSRTGGAVVELVERGAPPCAVPPSRAEFTRPACQPSGRDRQSPKTRPTRTAGSCPTDDACGRAIAALVRAARGPRPRSDLDDWVEFGAGEQLGAELRGEGAVSAE